MRRARGNNLRWIDTGGILGDLLNQSVQEDVLGDGDGHGTAKGVEEDGDGIAGGHVLFVEHDLDGDEGDLHAGARADAGQDLVPNPLACGGRRRQRVQHASADGEDGRANPRKGRVPANGGDAAANHD